MRHLAAVLLLASLCLVIACAVDAPEEPPAPQASLEDTGDSRADGFTSDQFLKGTYEEIVYMTDGRFEGDATVLEVADEHVSVQGSLVVVIPGEARRIEIQIASRGLIDGWNSTMYFMAQRRPLGSTRASDWQRVSVTLPGLDIDALVTAALMATIVGNDELVDDITHRLMWRNSAAPSYFDYLAFDLDENEMSYHSFFDQIVNEQTEPETVSFEVDAEEGFELGIFAFPISTLVGDLLGTHSYTLVATCDGAPCGFYPPECEGNRLHTYDGMGDLVSVRDCYAEEGAPCVESFINGTLPDAGCMHICGPVLEGMSQCRDGVAESCLNRNYSADECSFPERCIDPDDGPAHCGYF